MSLTIKESLSYLVVIIFTSAFITACDYSITDDTEPKAVIEAWIDNDGYPVVLFTSSASPSSEGSISDHVVNWGKVIISDGDQEVIMTGGPDGTYLPPYRYYTFDIQGIPGRTYHLTANFKNLKAKSSVYLPHPTSIDSVTVSKGEYENLRNTTLHFTTPDDIPAYYYLTMKDSLFSSQQVPCMLGTIKALNPGEKMSIPVYHYRQKIDGSVFVPQFHIGEKHEIRLNRITEDVYEFWTSYGNMINFSSSPFITTNSSLPTNITGGYGIFSARGYSSIKVEIKDSPESYTIRP